MTKLKRLAAVLLPLALALVAAVPANAAPAAASVKAAASSCPEFADPVPHGGSITNVSSVGIGVIHLGDGSCAHGTYDQILPPGKNTRDYFHWTEVTGAYIGDGYKCTQGINGVYDGPYLGSIWLLEPYSGGDWVINSWK